MNKKAFYQRHYGGLTNFSILPYFLMNKILDVLALATVKNYYLDS